MKGLNLLLLAVLSLAVMAAAAVVVGLAAPLPFLDVFRTSFLDVYNNWLFALLGIAAFILALWAFLLSLKPVERVRAIDQQGELGEYRISFEALENLVLQATRDIRGVKDTRTRLALKEAGLSIDLRIGTLPDLKVPELVQEIQTKVRDYVQEISGVDVAEVKVLVESITRDTKRK
jgi:uncharacterized alkaline shock family protein YloU